MKKVYVICPVTIADKDTTAQLDAYVAILEDDGYDVWYPARDTDQKADGFNIMLENSAVIHDADEIHVFYDCRSKGIHFDLGVAFALDFLTPLNKKIFKMIEAKMSVGGNGYEFVNMMKKWEGMRDGN